VPRATRVLPLSLEWTLAARQGSICDSETAPEIFITRYVRVPAPALFAFNHHVHHALEKAVSPQLLPRDSLAPGPRLTSRECAVHLAAIPVPDLLHLRAPLGRCTAPVPFSAPPGVSRRSHRLPHLPVHCPRRCASGNSARPPAGTFPTRAARRRVQRGRFRILVSRPVSVNSWITRYALPGVTYSRDDLGKICSSTACSAGGEIVPQVHYGMEAAGFADALPSGRGQAGQYQRV